MRKTVFVSCAVLLLLAACAPRPTEPTEIDVATSTSRIYNNGDTVVDYICQGTTAIYVSDGYKSGGVTAVANGCVTEG